MDNPILQVSALVRQLVTAAHLVERGEAGRLTIDLRFYFALYSPPPPAIPPLWGIGS